MGEMASPVRIRRARAEELITNRDEHATCTRQSTTFFPQAKGTVFLSVPLSNFLSGSFPVLRSALAAAPAKLRFAKALTPNRRLQMIKSSNTAEIPVDDQVTDVQNTSCCIVGGGP